MSSPPQALTYASYQQTGYRQDLGQKSLTHATSKHSGESSLLDTSRLITKPLASKQPAPSLSQMPGSSRVTNYSIKSSGDHLDTEIGQVKLLSEKMSISSKWRRDKRNCQLIAIKIMAAAGALFAYNFPFFMPKLRALTWGGILLGNAIAFPPKKRNLNNFCYISSAVLLGGGLAFLPEYFTQNKSQEWQAIGHILTSSIYIGSIYYIWRKALEDLDESYFGPTRAKAGAVTAVVTYKLVHAYMSGPWANFLGSVGVIFGNMIAFPPPPTACNQLQKFSYTLVPSALASLLNDYFVVDDNDKQALITAFGETLSLAGAWYYGNKGLVQQRMNVTAINGSLLDDPTSGAV